MIALLDTEVRRALARRLVRIIVLLIVAVILIASVIVFFKSHGPASPSGLVARIAACERGEYTPPEFRGQNIPPQFRQQFCDQYLRSRAEQDHRFHLSGLHGVMVGTSIPLMLICWLIGASLVGAEWKAGTITTYLTWEPRRSRLLLAKLCVVLTLAFVLTVLSQVVLSLALLPAAYIRGDTIVGAGFIGSIVTVILRAGLLSMMGSAIGFSIGSIGRSTAAGMGIGFAYLFIVEQALAGLLPWIRPWLITVNSFIMVSAVRIHDVIGRTPLQSGLVLAGYAVGFCVLASYLFRTRDVTA